MTLQEIVKVFNIESPYIITTKKGLDLSTIKKAKYIDTCLYWYDDPEHPVRLNWIDVEGIGYGWLWCTNKLRSQFEFLQRKAIKKYAFNLFKEVKPYEDILIYKNSEGYECYGFMNNNGMYYVEIRIHDKEMYWYK